MQLKLHLFIFCVSLPFLCSAANLLPEWEKAAVEKGIYQLPNWRSSDWGGRRSSPANPVIRRKKIFSIEGKIAVTLESSPNRENINMFYRTLKIPGKKKSRYRLSLKIRTESPRPVLTTLRLFSSSRGYASTSRLITPGPEWQQELLELTVPPGNSNLNIRLTLHGSGKITITECRLTEISLPPVPELKLTPDAPAVILQQKNPSEVVFNTPPGISIPSGSRIIITLPWGIRLLNTYPGELGKISLIPKKQITYEIKFSKWRSRSLFLALASDLDVSAGDLSGSIHIEHDGRKSETVLFPLKIMKDIEAVAPRNFLIGIPGRLTLSTLDGSYESELSRLRSGANIFTFNYIPIPPSRMRNARISHYPWFTLPPVKPEKHCNYAKLRDESFWSTHFLPHLRRNVLRQSKTPAALLCDYRLGQGRAIDCLCALCRAELADFAPALPRRNVMNYSNGMLVSRFRRDVAKFRKARLDALREAALHHLPVGGKGFSRRPLMLPVFTSFTQFHKETLENLDRAVIDLSYGLHLPNGEKYNAAVNFSFNRQLRQQCRKANPYCKVLLRQIPRLRYITPEILGFEIINAIINGYAGILLEVPSHSSYPFHAAIAESAGVIRDHEKFLRSREVLKHSWHLTQQPQLIKLPPVPDNRNYPMDLPEQFAALQLKVWKYGNETLVGIGNFSDSPQQTGLSSSAVPLTWRGVIDGQSVDFRTLKQGIRVTLKPYSWQFFHFRGI